MARMSSERSWGSIPEYVLLEIFSYLGPKDLLTAGETCAHWRHVSHDDMLWKRLLQQSYSIDPQVPICPGRTSWFEEYKRIALDTPSVCTEELTLHKDEVLHIGFSHNGLMFATSSKDGHVMVWETKSPVSLKYSRDMQSEHWKYAQYSQFNNADTLLLVSGVHDESDIVLNLGQIVVFSLLDDFQVVCKILNEPYDVFGSWFDDFSLLSGGFFSEGIETGHSEIILNFIEGGIPEVTKKEVLKFENRNASSIRYVMVTDGPTSNKSLCTNEIIADDPPEASNDGTQLYDASEDKIIIFTTGSKTFSPHEIGFKVIKKGRVSKMFDEATLHDTDDNGLACSHPDKVISLDGHIIGMCVSPDRKYLYINNRPWPPGYIITSPFEPPPIASEIEIQVIDLTTFEKGKKIYRAHRAFTPSEECFFIFLDVSEYYIASGAEDKHGYVWDRHYGVNILKLPHNDVVNAVAFNPVDPHMLVTISDDHLIRIWRSRSSLANIMSKEEISHFPSAIFLSKPKIS